MTTLREWKLRSFIVVLLTVTTLMTLGIVGTLVIAVRVPQVERESRIAVRNEAAQIAARAESLLGALQTRLELVAASESLVTRSDLSRLLEGAVQTGKGFRALYLVSEKGVVLAAGFASDGSVRAANVLGSDLSRNPLFINVQARGRATWSDKYLSALSGTETIGLAVPVGDRSVLLAEVPLSHVLSTVRLVSGQESSAIWVIDRHGEVVVDIDADTAPDAAGGERLNLLNLPVLHRAGEGGERAPQDSFEHEGKRYHAGVTRSQALDWYFVARSPAGLDNPRVQLTVTVVSLAFLSALVICLMVAPWWARHLTRPLRAIVGQARQVAAGEAASDWPRGRIHEFNKLSGDLESMALSLKEREQKFLTFFNASPVPMSVSDIGNNFVILDVSDVWCRQFKRSREETVGHNGAEIGLWASMEERAAFLANAKEGRYSGDATLVCGDGEQLICHIEAQPTMLGDRNLMVWSMEDVTEKRQMVEELRSLNADLESRVEQRTLALAEANDALYATIADLRRTQHDLVRAEKMAALGGLVAGVAHELNTPIGNGLMAVSTLNDQEREFRAELARGLRRSVLDKFLGNVEEATAIASRNLQRAADLVTSFKQVAVDQTSSQRRRFDLGDAVREIVMTLGPSLNRTPYRVSVDVPAGLLLDSYPGPLGQVLANLINNAVIHGFDGRADGTVQLRAWRDDDRLVLQVCDDGKGVPAALLDRIFDPFVTSRLGRGGSGLGLHICYNIVTNVLGGTLSVSSDEGKGAIFEIRIPPEAPQTAPEEAPLGAG